MFFGSTVKEPTVRYFREVSLRFRQAYVLYFRSGSHSFHSSSHFSSTRNSLGPNVMIFSKGYRVIGLGSSSSPIAISYMPALRGVFSNSPSANCFFPTTGPVSRGSSGQSLTPSHTQQPHAATHNPRFTHFMATRPPSLAFASAATAARATSARGEGRG